MCEEVQPYFVTLCAEALCLSALEPPAQNVHSLDAGPHSSDCSAQESPIGLPASPSPNPVD